MSTTCSAVKPRATGFYSVPASDNEDEETVPPTTVRRDTHAEARQSLAWRAVMVASGAEKPCTGGVYLERGENWHVQTNKSGHMVWQLVWPTGVVKDQFCTFMSSHGLGLRTLRSFALGEVVAKYTGEQISSEEFNRRCQAGAGCHTIRVQGKLMDGQNCWSGAQYINDARGTRHKQNVAFNDLGYVVAVSDIARGDELLTDYGDAYWQDTHQRQKLVHCT